jgi:hypothetical protein
MKISITTSNLKETAVRGFLLTHNFFFHESIKGSDFEVNKVSIFYLRIRGDIRGERESKVYHAVVIQILVQENISYGFQ